MLAFAFMATALEARLLGAHHRPVGAAIYLVIGCVFGPNVLDLLTASHVSALSGVESVACTFIGLSCGLPLGMHRLKSRHLDRVGYGLAVTVIAALLVGGIVYLAFRSIPLLRVSEHPALAVAAIVCGVTAAISSPTVMRDAVAMLLSDGPVSRLMPTALMTSRVTAVLAFGVAVAFVPDSPLGSVHSVLAALTLGLGVGIAFHLMVGSQHDPHRLMVATVGALALGGGLAESVSLAPIMVGLVSGFSIGLCSPASGALLGTIERLERPATVALFLLGGAHFAVQDSRLIFAAIGYVVVRFLSLRIAAVLSRPVSTELETSVPGLWRAYLYQGALTAAIALNFETLVPGDLGLLLEGMLLIAAIVNPFVSWNAARDLLRDVGETGRLRQAPRQEQEAAIAASSEVHA